MLVVPCHSITRFAPCVRGVECRHVEVGPLRAAHMVWAAVPQRGPHSVCLFALGRPDWQDPIAKRLSQGSVARLLGHDGKQFCDSAIRRTSRSRFVCGAGILPIGAWPGLPSTATSKLTTFTTLSLPHLSAAGLHGWCTHFAADSRSRISMRNCEYRMRF